MAYEDFGIDLCPVCGKEVHITGWTKDGRIVGSCGDAFTVEAWNDDQLFENQDEARERFERDSRRAFRKD